MTTNKPKRHHFLAEMYLDGFTDGKFVQVYHRKQKKIVPQTPVNTAVQGYLYQRIDRNGNKLVDAEDYLSKIETACVDIIGKFIQKESFSTQERMIFSEFVAMAHRRTPEQIDTLRLMREQHSNLLKNSIYKDVESVKKEIRRYKPFFTEIALNSIAKGVYEKYKDNPGVTDHRNVSTDSLSIARALAPHIYNKNWRFLSVEEGQHYITSDAPVSFYFNSDKQSEGTNYVDMADIAFPITQNLLLLMEGHGAKWGHWPAQRGWTEGFNETTAKNCHSYVYGPNKEYIENLRRKLNLDNTEWTPMFSIDELEKSDKIYPDGAPMKYRTAIKK